MPIRITGLNSGLDTESIISALVSSYSYKTDKYKKAQTKLSWKQDAWKELNTKIYSLYKNVGNLRLESSYNMRKATVSDTTKASVTTSSSVTNGSYSVQITQLAQAGYLTGSEVKSSLYGVEVTKDTRLGYLGYSAGHGYFNVKVNGDIKSVVVDKDTTINEVVEQLNKAGVKASFDEKNKRFFISAKEAGSSNDFEILNGTNGEDILKALGIYENNEMIGKKIQLTDADWENLKGSSFDITVRAEDGSETVKTIKVDDTNPSIDNIIQQLKDAGVEAKLNAAGKLEIFADNGKTFSITNSKDSDNEKNLLKELGLEKTLEETWIEKATGTQQVQVVNDWERWIGSSFKVTVDGEETEIKINEDVKSVEDIVELLEDAGVNAVFNNGRLEISAKEEGSQFSITKGKDGSALLEKLGLEETESAIRIDGQGSIVYVNGAKFEGETNTVTVNGLSIQATGVTGAAYDPTGSNAINITVATDVQGIYDKVKDFLSQYNSLVNEMTKLYNSESAKGYEPLTDDEKDAMSDSEVEKWEAKIKSALLRRDDTLSGVISAMTNAMSKSYTIDGKSYSLASFGIQTLGFLNAPENEQNAYHIYGDEDDPNTSGKEDRLMAMINEDPDVVIKFMKELASGLYSSLDTKMKSTSLSSIYTVYNDKEMASEYSDYTSTIRKWQERLEQQQDYYYDKFAQMESAMAKLNSQSSSMSGFFGM